MDFEPQWIIMNRLFNIAKHKFINYAPAQLVLFVTKRCNARCKFCFYPPEKTPELALGEIEKLSQSIGSLHWLLIGGGEPLLRKDLADICILFHKNAGVRYLQVPTNGYFPDRTEEFVRKVGEKCPKLKLVVTVSIDDNIPEKHNDIRLLKNCYENAMETMKRLKKLQSSFPLLGTGCNMTFTSYNQDRFLEIYKYGEANYPSDHITVGLVRGDPVCEEAKQGIDMAKYREVHEYMSRSSKRYNFYSGFEQRFARAKDVVAREHILSIKKNKKMEIPCLAGIKSLVIQETGKVYPCEVLPDKYLGNIRDFDCDFGRVWRSSPAKEFRRWEKTCHCTYECAMGQSIIYTPRGILRTIQAA
jgi:MoaA/NifB/PqqE/SkfB family radical SAM enzyme